MGDSERTAEVFEPFFPLERDLGRSRSVADQIGARYRETEAAADSIRQEQRLIELSFTQSFNVEGDRNNNVERLESRKMIGDEAGQWSSQ